MRLTPDKREQIAACWPRMAYEVLLLNFRLASSCLATATLELSIGITCTTSPFTPPGVPVAASKANRLMTNIFYERGCELRIAISTISFSNGSGDKCDSNPSGNNFGRTFFDSSFRMLYNAASNEFR